MIVLSFLAGMMVGACLGVLVMGLMSAASDADDWEDAWS